MPELSRPSLLLRRRRSFPTSDPRKPRLGVLEGEERCPPEPSGNPFLTQVIQVAAWGCGPSQAYLGVRRFTLEFSRRTPHRVTCDTERQ